jgi:predicted transcriptional regulator
MKKRETAAEDMITTTVAFDRAIYKQLGHLAVDQEIPVRDLIRQAVEEYLRRHQKGGKAS